MLEREIWLGGIRGGGDEGRGGGELGRGGGGRLSESESEAFPSGMRSSPTVCLRSRSIPSLAVVLGECGVLIMSAGRDSS